MTRDRVAREARRRTGSVQLLRWYRLGDEPAKALLVMTTATERLAMVWELAVAVYGTACVDRRSVPRERWPARMIRGCP